MLEKNRLAVVPTDAQQAMVRTAARALAAANLAHAYGHCSLRLDDSHFLVCAARPMGCIDNQPGTVVPLAGPLPPGVLGEVRIHREIYRLRPNIGGVCRVMPPATMALSTIGVVPRARHGVGAFVASTPFWDDPRLLRDDTAAIALAQAMGENAAIVMRGNGAVVAGETLPQAVTLAWFLEDAARVERDVRTMGGGAEHGLLSDDEIAARQGWGGGVVERMWLHLTGETL